MSDPTEVDVRRADVLALMVSAAPCRVAEADHDATAWADRLRIAGSRLHPWLAHRVAALGLAESLPADVRASLESAARASVIDELRRRSAFRAIVGTLDGAGIPFVVLKGMALAYTAYHAPAARPMGDIDLWVRPEQRDEVLVLLETLGWRVPPRYAAYPRTANVVLVELPGLRCTLELHSPPRSIARDPVGGAAAVWARCESRMVAGLAVRVCTRGDQLAHLAIHLARGHMFRDGLVSLLDITLVARGVDRAEEWREIGAAHRADAVTEWTVPALVLARDLLAAPVPDAYFVAAGRHLPSAAIVAAATEQLWDRETSNTLWDLENMVTAGAGGPTDLFRALGAFVRRYYGGAPAPGQGRWSALLGRVHGDLTQRLPRYLRAIRSGELRPGAFARVLEMRRKRDLLRDALEEPSRPLSAPPPGPSAPR